MSFLVLYFSDWINYSWLVFLTCFANFSEPEQSPDFPMSVEMLLNVLQAIAPLKHYSRLREIIGVKLPPGFPVQIGMYKLFLWSNYIVWIDWHRLTISNYSSFRCPNNTYSLCKGYILRLSIHKWIKSSRFHDSCWIWRGQGKVCH